MKASGPRSRGSTHEEETAMKRALAVAMMMLGTTACGGTDTGERTGTGQSQLQGHDGHSSTPAEPVADHVDAPATAHDDTATHDTTTAHDDTATHDATPSADPTASHDATPSPSTDPAPTDPPVSHHTDPSH
jgi:hypothetical protein